MPSNRLIVVVSLSILLDFSPRAAAQDKPRTDCYGDPLPAGAIGRLGTTRLRHGSPIHEMVFLPDGKTLASVDCEAGGMVALWDLETGKERRHFRIGGGHRVQATFAPDGQCVALSDGEKVCLYELATGTLRWQNSAAYEPGGAGPPIPVFFSGDGRILASVSGNWRHVHLWHADTGKKLHSLDMEAVGGFRSVRSVLPSPDGKLLITTNAETNTRAISAVWALPTGKRLYDIRGRARDSAMAFAPDGKTLAGVAEDGRTIELREAATDKLLRTFDDRAAGPAARNPARDSSAGAGRLGGRAGGAASAFRRRGGRRSDTRSPGIARPAHQAGGGG